MNEFQLKEKALSDQDNRNNKWPKSITWDQLAPTPISFSMEAHIWNPDDHDISIINRQVCIDSYLSIMLV